MKNIVTVTAMMMAATALVTAQSKTGTATQTTETLVVLGVAEPVPLADSAASVVLLPMNDSIGLTSGADALRDDAAVLIEQRGAGGVQDDVTMRGGSFAETLVLVNGFRINDAQTAHHNLDLPLPLGMLDVAEVLEGAGSTLHGADALSGVVDFASTAPTRTGALLRAGIGSWGGQEQEGVGTLARKQNSTRVALSRNFSKGFISDRDYRTLSAAAENWTATRLGTTDVMLAASDKAFGADQFYGNFNSWERTKAWLATMRQDLGERTVASFGWRRHTDDFVLWRTNPGAYANNHTDTSWQARLQRTEHLHAATLLMGGEENGDSIRSFNTAGSAVRNALGVHARNRGAGYVDVDLRPAKARWTLAAGVREEVFSGGRAVFAPHLAGAWRVNNALKLRASGGYGFRMPTYTDLYYNDPGTTGNAQLKPESAWSADAGADWTVTPKLMLSATGFYTREHDAIDYVRPNANAKWTATNLNGLRFAGAEASARWVPTRDQTVQVSWTAISGNDDSTAGLQSEYVFNYAKQNLRLTWTTAVTGWMTLANTVQSVTRYGQTSYAVWDATLKADRGRVRPYVRGKNLGNTSYQEIVGVPMQARSLLGGLEMRF